MINSRNVPDLFDATVHNNDGDKIGSVGQVYLDSTSGEPTWATVTTGLFGSSQSFVPLKDATWSDGVLRVPFEKSFIKDAPRVDDDGELSPEEEETLFAYYGHHSPSRTDNTVFDQDTDRTTVGHDTSGPVTDDAMTRSEEHLQVGTQKVEAGRARLRKYVVSEQETVTVPVSHEEVTLHREPITDANIGDALDGPAISEEEHEVILTGERVITSKETVPVERVRLDTETVTEQRTVTDEVRHEEIELITDDEDRSTR